MEFVKELINGRDGKMVFDCNKVESTIIDTKSPSSAFLSNKKNKGRVRVKTRENHTIFDHFRDQPFHLEFLRMGVAI